MLCEYDHDYVKIIILTITLTNKEKKMEMAAVEKGNWGVKEKGNWKKYCIYTSVLLCTSAVVLNS